MLEHDNGPLSIQQQDLVVEMLALPGGSLETWNERACDEVDRLSQDRSIIIADLVTAKSAAKGIIGQFFN